MSDVIDKKSARINVSTYSAIQTVKYGLSARTSSSAKSKAIQVFQRKDRLTSPVLPNLPSDIRNAKRRYEEERMKNLKLLNQKKKIFSISASTVTSSKRVKLTSAEINSQVKQKLLSSCGRDVNLTSTSSMPTKSIIPPKTFPAAHTSSTVSPNLMRVDFGICANIDTSPNNNTSKENTQPSKKRKVQSKLNLFFKNQAK